MIKHITHAGVLHVEEVLSVYQNNLPCLVISILDNNTPFGRPEFKKFHDYLSLCFKDRCEEDYGLRDHWPDEPNNDFNFNILYVDNERLCAYSDAKIIVEFFEKYHAQTQEYNLIAHCKSGVGRSAAIAEFFGIVHNIPYAGTDPRGRFMPNCRLTRLLTKAYYDKYQHADNGNRINKVHKLGLPQRCYITS